MKVVVINGTEKHGVTYRLKEIFLEQFWGKQKSRNSICLETALPFAQDA